jgi:hypothetical protein
MCVLFLAALPFGVIMFVLGYGNADYLHGATLSVTMTGVAVALIEASFFAPILLGARR